MDYVCEKCGLGFSGYIRSGRLVRCSSCKRKVVHKKETGEITNLFDLSTRTIGKILARLNMSCSICGWNVATCDLHHIVSRKKGGSNHHTNLACVCPNCHRAIHNGKLTTSITLQEQIGDNWLKEYAPPLKITNLPKKEFVCKTCGGRFELKRKNSKYCSTKCFGISQREKGIVIPSKEELQILIDNNSWVAIGRMFGVSDNAVRKWAIRREIL